MQSLIGAPLVSDLELERIQQALRDEEKRTKAEDDSKRSAEAGLALMHLRSEIG